LNESILLSIYISYIVYHSHLKCYSFI
jgi:hypothetical protein